MVWKRDAWESWEDQGRTSMAERSVAEVKRVLNTHEPEPMDDALEREVDRIVRRHAVIWRRRSARRRQNKSRAVSQAGLGEALPFGAA